MRDISSSWPTRKTFHCGLDMPSVGAAYFSPCHRLVAPAAGSGSLLMSKRTGYKWSELTSLSLTVRSTTAGWSSRLLLSLSRWVDRVTHSQGGWFPVVANVRGM